MTVGEPLREWSVAMDGEQHGFELRFEALSPPAEIAGDDARRAGGRHGRLRAAVRGHRRRCAPAASRSRSAASASAGTAGASPTGSASTSARTVSAWPGAGYGVALSSVRPSGAAHAEEPIWAALLDEAGTVRVDDPRLSTTYDGDGRQRRAGLELWVDGDEYPLRGSGEVLCGSTLDLGALRLDCAFFRWRIEGETGVGRYDVLRRA